MLLPADLYTITRTSDFENLCISQQNKIMDCTVLSYYPILTILNYREDAKPFAKISMA
jgi:hypothetical protein